MQLQTIKVVLAEGGVGIDLSSALKSVVHACESESERSMRANQWVAPFGSSCAFVEIHLYNIL